MHSPGSAPGQEAVASDAYQSLGVYFSSTRTQLEATARLSPSQGPDAVGTEELRNNSTFQSELKNGTPEAEPKERGCRTAGRRCTAGPGSQPGQPHRQRAPRPFREATRATAPNG